LLLLPSLFPSFAFVLVSVFSSAKSLCADFSMLIFLACSGDGLSCLDAALFPTTTKGTCQAVKPCGGFTNVQW
jgi:hypothetical protein